MVHRIDSQDRLIEFDAAFRCFADANGVPELAEHALGRPLWDFMDSDDAGDLFRGLVARARAGHPATVETRCDSPHVTRFVEMTISANVVGEVQFTSRLTAARYRDVPEVEVGEPELLRLCAWCFRAERDGWRDIEAVVEADGLLQRATKPVVSHGICPSCLNDRLVDLRVAA